jgi:hypothetical protein
MNRLVVALAVGLVFCIPALGGDIPSDGFARPQPPPSAHQSMDYQITPEQALDALQSALLTALALVTR